MRFLKILLIFSLVFQSLELRVINDNEIVFTYITVKVECFNKTKIFYTHTLWPIAYSSVDEFARLQCAFSDSAKRL